MLVVLRVKEIPPCPWRNFYFGYIRFDYETRRNHHDLPYQKHSP
jgi:hypothetical protein